MKTNRLWYGNGQNVSNINARFRCYECVFLIFNRLACHSIFAANSTGDSVCVVADDTDVFILLLYLSVKCHVTLYFRQGTNSSKDGVTYHNVTALSSHLGENICEILPAFHALTGSDFTKGFFRRSKVESFKTLSSKPEKAGLLLSMNTDHAVFEKVTDFILHIIYNRPESEKSPGDSRYAMLFVGKGEKREFSATRLLPPDQKSLNMKILRANLICHGWVNCLNNTYHSLDPSHYGWIDNGKLFTPFWFEGTPLPNEQEIQDYLGAENQVFRKPMV